MLPLNTLQNDACNPKWQIIVLYSNPFMHILPQITLQDVLQSSFCTQHPGAFQCDSYSKAAYPSDHSSTLEFPSVIANNLPLI